MQNGCILKISLICLYFPLLICYSYNQCQTILHANGIFKTASRVLTNTKELCMLFSNLF